MLKQKEHDFSSKLRQQSVIGHLKAYIAYQRGLRQSGKRAPFPRLGPVSINLDLTTACNFACPHCVDSGIINTGEYLKLEEIKKSITNLVSHGLLSVILIGGGEPTLHKNFEEIVRFIKEKGLQLGIVTNGSRFDRMFTIADVLEEFDWLRISLDAANQDTFIKSHRPKKTLTLKEILKNAQELKEKNPHVSLGYSFVIVWDSIYVSHDKLFPNLDEMVDAVNLAKEHSFDYVSFKPFLLRLEGSQKETLLASTEEKREAKIIESIRSNLEAAKIAAGGEIKVLESVNLQAMMEDKVHELKSQPRICHAQFFRSVFAPSGIFHCPAFRGVEAAKIGERNGYTTEDEFNKTLECLERSLIEFNAEQECNEVGCFYHHMNWWIDDFIQSDKDIDEIESIKDNNFFL